MRGGRREREHGDERAEIEQTLHGFSLSAINCSGEVLSSKCTNEIRWRRRAEVIGERERAMDVGVGPDVQETLHPAPLPPLKGVDEDVPRRFLENDDVCVLNDAHGVSVDDDLRTGDALPSDG